MERRTLILPVKRHVRRAVMNKGPLRIGCEHMPYVISVVVIEDKGTRGSTPQ